MSRFLNAAGVAAIGMTLAATLLIAEPGFASDLGADAAAPNLVYPGNELLDAVTVQESPEEGELPSPTESEPAPSEEPAAPAVTAQSLAALVSQMPRPANVDAELRCLAGAVYFESRGESLPGQLAVAHVVINRMKSGRFASSLCGVVHQPSQFSFVRGGKMPRIREGLQWDNALAIARIAQDGSWKNNAVGALFFHARHVSPNWGKKRIAQIDNHIFYR